MYFWWIQPFITITIFDDSYWHQATLNYFNMFQINVSLSYFHKKYKLNLCFFQYPLNLLSCFLILSIIKGISLCTHLPFVTTWIVLLISEISPLKFGGGEVKQGRNTCREARCVSMFIKTATYQPIILSILCLEQTKYLGTCSVCSVVQRFLSLFMLDWLKCPEHTTDPESTPPQI